MASRPIVLGLARVFVLVLCHLPLLSAAPAFYAPSSPFLTISESPSKPVSDPGLWLYLGIAAALVLSGGAFAGLTIALMGQVRAPLLFTVGSPGTKLYTDVMAATYRMRSIYRLFRPPVKARKGKTPPAYSVF